MGFRLKVEGASETIELGQESIEVVKFKMDTPDDSNARSTDLGVTISVLGKILTAVDGEAADKTVNLANWSLVSSEKANCYRKVTLQVISADQVVRDYVFPNAFIVDFKENYGDSEGVGTFKLVMKQKKDKLKSIAITGGYPM